MKTSILVALLLFAGCVRHAPSTHEQTHVGSLVPGPQGPATINGFDAGSYPRISLPVAALPHCDAGESYVPADGGGQRCALAQGVGTTVTGDAGEIVIISDGGARGTRKLVLTADGSVLGVTPATVYNWQTAGNGVWTQEIAPVTTDGGGSANLTFTLPGIDGGSISGVLTIIVNGHAQNDGGRNAAGVVISEGIVNTGGGTCFGYPSGGPMGFIGGSTDAAAGWGISLNPFSSCTVTVPVNGSSAFKLIHWNATVQFASVR